MKMKIYLLLFLGLLISGNMLAQDAQQVSIDVNAKDKNNSFNFEKEAVITIVNLDKKNKTTVQFLEKEGGRAEELAKDIKVDKYELKYAKEGDELTLTVDSPKEKTVKFKTSFILIVNGVKFPVTHKAEEDPEEETETESSITPYWNYAANFSFSLDSFKNTDGKNCGVTSESISFTGVNRLIYDAKTGLTTQIDKEGNTVKHRKTVVKSGEPLVLVVENVNPSLYDVQVLDSTVLMHNESNQMLEALLFSKSENLSGLKGMETAHSGSDEENYLKMRTRLMLARTEMAEFLELDKYTSPYEQKSAICRQKALEHIEQSVPSFFDGDKAYTNISFLQLVDLFLNQTAEDSTLNREIKELYRQFIVSPQPIVYYYPQVPEVDVLNLGLTIKAKPNTPYTSLLTDSRFKHPTQSVYVKGFVKADISAGLYYGFKGDQVFNIVSDSATISNSAGTGDSTVYSKRIVNENTGKQEFGFASFVHLYPKWGVSANVGLVLGAGVSFSDDVRVRYFTGVSGMFGKYNRLCLNAGVVWGNYSSLSNQYRISTTPGEYDPLPVNTSSLKYVDRFRGTGFVSLTYNLPFLKRTPEQKADKEEAKQEEEAESEESEKPDNEEEAEQETETTTTTTTTKTKQ